jgi:hypothetical protein
LETLGYILFVFVGISLGLLGGGGSILTVPILVYFLGLSAEISTAYSLFLVGIGALAGSIGYIQSKQLNYKVAILFGIPSIISVYSVRKWLMPVIPNEVLSINDFIISKDLLIMLIFSVVMIIAAFSMIKKSEIKTEKHFKPIVKTMLILIEGIVVGAITGFVGAGGGFLIVPALAVLLRLPIKEAIATSLLIIAIKSLFGFLGDLSNQIINWELLLSLTFITLTGIVLGLFLNKKIHAKNLKHGFGYFILISGILIITKEILFKT